MLLYNNSLENKSKNFFHAGVCFDRDIIEGGHIWQELCHQVFVKGGVADEIFIID